jgi:hypothetical protein
MNYFIQQGTKGPIKIGFTGEPTVDKRLAKFQTGHSEVLTCLATVEGTKKDEAILHKKFAHLRIRREWFKPTKELLDYIQSIKVTPKPDKPVDASGLINKFFHSYEPNDASELEIRHQGIVGSEPSKGIFLVQYFDWLFGQPCNQGLVRIEDMLTWKFYRTKEEWVEAYEEYANIPAGQGTWEGTAVGDMLLDKDEDEELKGTS